MYFTFFFFLLQYLQWQFGQSDDLNMAAWTGAISWYEVLIQFCGLHHPLQAFVGITQTKQAFTFCSRLSCKSMAPWWANFERRMASEMWSLTVLRYIVIIKFENADSAYVSFKISAAQYFWQEQKRLLIKNDGRQSRLKHLSLLLNSGLKHFTKQR